MPNVFCDIFIIISGHFYDVMHMCIPTKSRYIQQEKGGGIEGVLSKQNDA